jgi:hypothetical protein
MVVVTHRSRAKDGARFHAHICDGGYNQVKLAMQVRLGDQNDPEQRQHVTDPANARVIAQRFAKEQGIRHGGRMTDQDSEQRTENW